MTNAYAAHYSTVGNTKLRKRYILEHAKFSFVVKTYLLSGSMLFFLQVQEVTAQVSASQDFVRAEVLRKEMKPDSAIFYYERAITGFISIGQKQRVLDTYNQLGVVLTRQDKYEAARVYLEKAERLAPEIPAVDSLGISTTYITLGVIEAAEKNVPASLQYHFKALGIRQRILGEQHADVATSYGNIGNVYFRRGDYDSAIVFHEKARIIREKINGEKSAEVTQTYSNLGNAFKAKKDYTRALIFYEQALANKIQQLGADHKEAAKYYNNIADVYLQADDKILAVKYQQLAAKAIRP